MKENAPIVITHGTDTMVETGLYLQRGVGELHAPIVLTGAMTPLGFEGSDSLYRYPTRIGRKPHWNRQLPSSGLLTRVTPIENFRASLSVHEPSPGNA